MSATYADLAPGNTYTSYTRTVTETDLVNFTSFAGLKLPIFIDEVFAREHSSFKTRIVPGFLTCSIVGGMMESVLGRSTLAALGMDEMRFPNPVRPGDTIHARVDVDEKRDMKDGARGLLSLTVRAFNQTGMQVLHFKTKVIVSREPPQENLPTPVIQV